MSGVGLSWRSNGVSASESGPRRPLGLGVLVTVLVGFTVILIPMLYVMFEERFPRTIAQIEDDGAPPRREAPAQ